jgi:hypothetical protein
MSTSTSTISWSRVTRFAVIEAISNLVIFGIGSVAGASWQANGQSNGMTITWYMVLGTSLVPFFVAAGVTALLGLAWKSAAKVMAWIGLIFALVTVPVAFLATTEIGTAIALGSMHVVVGIAWFMAVRPRA